MPRYVGARPTVEVGINGVKFPALIDTGSQVTTIRQAAFKVCRNGAQLTQPPEAWLQIIATNGKPVPILGYWEPTIQIEDTELPCQGVIVIEVPEDDNCPVVLGMNVLGNCYPEVLEALKKALLTASRETQSVINQTIQVLAAQQKFSNSRGEICHVRIKDSHPVKLQPRTETLIWCKACIGVQGQDY